MSIYVDPKGVEHRARHILADGRVLEDITGYPIPNNEQNAGIYHVLQGIVERIVRECDMNNNISDTGNIDV